jgi:hypothetical protein
MNTVKTSQHAARLLSRIKLLERTLAQIADLPRGGLAKRLARSTLCFLEAMDDHNLRRK